jgi:hypothetical protein
MPSNHTIICLKTENNAIDQEETHMGHAPNEDARYVAKELVTFFQNTKLGCPAFLPRES